MHNNFLKATIINTYLSILADPRSAGVVDPANPDNQEKIAKTIFDDIKKEGVKDPTIAESLSKMKLDFSTGFVLDVIRKNRRVTPFSLQEVFHADSLNTDIISIGASFDSEGSPLIKSMLQTASTKGTSILEKAEGRSAYDAWLDNYKRERGIEEPQPQEDAEPSAIDEANTLVEAKDLLEEEPEPTKFSLSLPEIVENFYADDEMKEHYSYFNTLKEFELIPALKPEEITDEFIEAFTSQPENIALLLEEDVPALGTLFTRDLEAEELSVFIPEIGFVYFGPLPDISTISFDNFDKQDLKELLSLVAERVQLNRDKGLKTD